MLWPLQLEGSSSLLCRRMTHRVESTISPSQAGGLSRFLGFAIKQVCFLCFRWCLHPGAKEELHDAEAVWVDAHSHPWGAQSV